MTTKYTRLDNKHMAIVTTQEVTSIVNIKTIQDERVALTEAYEKRIAEIDEALARFETEPVPNDPPEE